MPYSLKIPSLCYKNLNILSQVKFPEIGEISSFSSYGKVYKKKFFWVVEKVKSLVCNEYII